MTHADLVGLLETMRDVIWTEGEYKLSQHDVNAAISALNSGEVVLVPGAALRDVAAERERQVSQEGWTPEHDSEHTAGDLGLAGACYAMHTAMIFEGNQQSAVPSPWPFEASWWKPKDPRRNLVKAAALIVAEIERIDRAMLARKP